MFDLDPVSGMDPKCKLSATQWGPRLSLQRNGSINSILYNLIWPAICPVSIYAFMRDVSLQILSCISVLMLNTLRCLHTWCFKTFTHREVLFSHNHWCCQHFLPVNGWSNEASRVVFRSGLFWRRIHAEAAVLISGNGAWNRVKHLSWSMASTCHSEHMDPPTTTSCRFGSPWDDSALLNGKCIFHITLMPCQCFSCKHHVLWRQGRQHETNTNYILAGHTFSSKCVTLWPYVSYLTLVGQTFIFQPFARNTYCRHESWVLSHGCDISWAPWHVSFAEAVTCCASYCRRHKYSINVMMWRGNHYGRSPHMSVFRLIVHMS